MIAIGIEANNLKATRQTTATTPPRLTTQSTDSRRPAASSDSSPAPPTPPKPRTPKPIRLPRPPRLPRNLCNDNLAHFNLLDSHRMIDVTKVSIWISQATGRAATLSLARHARPRSSVKSKISHRDIDLSPRGPTSAGSPGAPAALAPANFAELRRGAPAALFYRRAPGGRAGPLCSAASPRSKLEREREDDHFSLNRQIVVVVVLAVAPP